MNWNYLVFTKTATFENVVELKSSSLKRSYVLDDNKNTDVTEITNKVIKLK